MFSLGGKDAPSLQQIAARRFCHRDLGQSDEILIPQFTNIYPIVYFATAD